MTCKWTIGAILMVVGLAGTLRAADKPNIVFMMIDDLGAEAVGCYGGESYSTPHMDALADRGMRFENAYSAPACMSTRAQLMTGRYPFRSGLPSNINDVARENGGWGADEITVANLLQDAGYTTAISGKWHLAQIDRFPNHLDDKGFEYQNAWGWIKGTQRTRRYWEATSYRDKRWIQDPPGVYGPDAYCDYAIDFMKEQKKSDKPFFLYYPMVLLHSPWPQTPDNIADPQEGWTPEDNLRIPETSKWSKQNFDAMVAYTDKLVGRMTRAIDELGLAENTLFIVTADNGTITKVTSQYKGRPVRGGKMSAGETGTRVPLIASWKGRIKAGSVNDHLIDFTDILPTFVELGKGRMPEDRVIDGRSFLGHLLNRPNTPTREWVFAGYEKNAMIRSHKYLLDVEGRLFDVSKDRYHPLLLTKASYSKEAEAAHRTLEEVMKSLGHPYTGVKQSKKKAE